MVKIRIPLPDVMATEKFAEWLALHLQSGDVVVLQGMLGAGKTTFVRAALRILGVDGEIPSPTFTLLQTYETPAFLVSHFDLYRLKSEQELEELGWDDALAQGVVVVEWPERILKCLPKDYLLLHFMMDERGDRSCSVEPHGSWIERLREKNA